MAIQARPSAADIRVDATSLVRVGSGYRVRLVGYLRPVWIRSYLALWPGLKFFSRFHLDVATQQVSFSSDELAASDTAAVLEILAAMVRLTNRRTMENSELLPSGSVSGMENSGLLTPVSSPAHPSDGLPRAPVVRPR